MSSGERRSGVTELSPDVVAGTRRVRVVSSGERRSGAAELRPTVAAGAPPTRVVSSGELSPGVSSAARPTEVVWLGKGSAGVWAGVPMMGVVSSGESSPNVSAGVPMSSKSPESEVIARAVSGSLDMGVPNPMVRMRGAITDAGGLIVSATGDDSVADSETPRLILATDGNSMASGRRWGMATGAVVGASGPPGLVRVSGNRPMTVRMVVGTGL